MLFILYVLYLIVLLVADLYPHAHHSGIHLYQGKLFQPNYFIVLVMLHEQIFTYPSKTVIFIKPFFNAHK